MFRYYDSQPSTMDLRSWEIRTGEKDLEAARMMILLTEYLDIESRTPGWLVYIPLRNCPGAIFTFICTYIYIYIFIQILITNEQPGRFSKIL